MKIKLSFVSKQKLSCIVVTSIDMKKLRRLVVILSLVMLTRSNGEEENKEMKPDPYFEEWKREAWQRPSQCHVCRLMVTELYSALNRTNKKDYVHTSYQLDKNDKGKKPIVYDKSEIRLLETMENVCDQMKSYVSRARRKFPYVKGVKSHFREGLDNLKANSAVKLNIESPPDDVVDDTTKEIIRLKFKCVQMLEEYEDDITEWYFKYREEDLLKWLCKDRILKNEDQGCLSESDELLAPEDNATTMILPVRTETEENSQEKSEEKSESEIESENTSEPEDTQQNIKADDIDYSESHLEL